VGIDMTDFLGDGGRADSAEQRRERLRIGDGIGRIVMRQNILLG
jgi:hypothetical protein